MLVTLCACAEPPADLCTLANPDFQDPVTTLHLLGEVAAINVTAPLHPCDGARVDAAVEVFDPDNLALPARLARRSHSGDFTVEFTALEPGPHYVRVNFLPALGTVQFLVPIAVARTPEAPLVEPFPDDMTRCRRLARTKSGGVLCEGNLFPLALYRGGVIASTFPGRSAVVAGDVIWSLDDTNVLERRRDTGTSVVLEGRLEGIVSGTAGGLHTETDAMRIIGAPGQYQYVHWDGQALTEVARGPASYSASYELEDGQVVEVDSRGQVRVAGGALLVRGSGSFNGVDALGGWSSDLIDGVSLLRRPWAGRGRLTMPMPENHFLVVDSRSAAASRVPRLISRSASLQSRHILLTVKEGLIQYEVWTLAEPLVVLDDDWVITVSADRHHLSFFRR